jgi:hypothetical protein
MALAGMQATHHLQRSVTDQYADAYEMFADLRAHFATKMETVLSIDLSPRDAGLMRLLGGVALPDAVSQVNLMVGPRDHVPHGVVRTDREVDARYGVVLFDDWQSGDLYTSHSSRYDMIQPMFFGLYEDKTLAELRLHERIALHLCLQLTPTVFLQQGVDGGIPRLAAAPVLAPHWRTTMRGAPYRPGEMRLWYVPPSAPSYVRSTVYLQGPSAEVEEQLRLLPVDPLAVDRWEAFDTSAALDERRHPCQWPAVSRRIVRAVAALAQLEPRLSAYMLLWIVDRLPGCVFHPELRKLRCVEATATAVRAKLDARRPRRLNET